MTDPRHEKDTRPKAKHDMLGYIDATIEYERGNSKGPTPPGGYALGLDKAEADFVCKTERMDLGCGRTPPDRRSGFGRTSTSLDAST